MNHDHDYAVFATPEGPLREPGKFQHLKKDDNFVAYLARHVSDTTSDGDSAATIAERVLKLAKNDPEFAVKITGKLKEFKGAIQDAKITKINKLIRSVGLLQPTKFFGTRNPRTRRTALFPQRGASSIIPPDLTETLQPSLDKMLAYLAGNKKEQFPKVELEVLQVLEGHKQVDRLPITRENCEEYLTAVKLWEFALTKASVRDAKKYSFAAPSYILRTYIAEKGNLPAHKVFTKTLDPRQYEDWNFLEVQSNWIPERARLHESIIRKNTVLALDLSRRLNTDKPSVWAVRGNTGAGKTYSLGTDAYFKRALDTKGEPSGAINPDVFKGLLKVETPGLSHAQLHKEGSALSFQFAQALGKEAVNATMIIDMRLAKGSQIDEEVIGRAEIRQGGAMIMDVETPVTTSINRVLIRPYDGNDPVVPLWAIKQGYEEVRGERAAVLKKVQESDTVEHFKFYITDDRGEQKLAAKKENGKFEVMSGMQEAMQRASEKPAPDEVDKIVDQVIDDRYIELARTRDHISAAKIGMIERWKGYTVRQALERHCEGLGP